MASQPRAWASVGASKLAWNQSRTAGEKGASGSAIGAIAAIGPHSVPRCGYFDQMFTIGGVAPRSTGRYLIRGACEIWRHGWHGPKDPYRRPVGRFVCSTVEFEYESSCCPAPGQE